MKILKRAGWLAASAAPLCLMLLIQVLASVGFAVAAGVMIAVQNAGAVNQAELMQQTALWIMDHYMVVLVVSQLISIVPFAFWYYFGFARKQKRVSVKRLFTLKTAGVFILMGAGFYLLLASVYLKGVEYLLPDLMESYSDLMEQSGVGDLTFLSVVATLILAPVGEELVFRGVTLKLAGRVCGKFWAANLIQAVFFGIAHMNWVQGVYAFGLGLLLGFFRQKYDSLYASILLHTSFNFFGTYLATALGLLPETVLLYVVLVIVGVLLTVLALRLLKTDLRAIAERNAEKDRTSL